MHLFAYVTLFQKTTVKVNKLPSWKPDPLLGFLPQTHVLKNLSNDVPLVNIANDSHFAGALGADSWP